MKKALEEIKERHKNGYPALVEQICSQIRDYWEKNGKPRLVFGLSGGIDSTVVAYLAVKAVGKEHVVPITMPAWEGDRCVEMAKLVNKELGTEGHIIGISDIVTNVIRVTKKSLGKDPDRITIGNIASRTRVNLLYAIARELKARVLGTGNRTEFVQGYATKFGTPNSCDLGILDELYKTDVSGMAVVLNAPKEIIDQTPSTGFFPEQTHHEELGASMEEQDAAVFLLFDGNMAIDEIIRDYGASREFIKTIVGRYERSEHKRMLRQPHIKIGFLSDCDAFTKKL